jgi:hypothetical protein
MDGLGRARRGGRDGVAAACGLGEVGGAGMVETARDRGGAALPMGRDGVDWLARPGFVGSVKATGWCLRPCRRGSVWYKPVWAGEVFVLIFDFLNLYKSKTETGRTG